jgi:hypothetical protein
MTGSPRSRRRAGKGPDRVKQCTISWKRQLLSSKVSKADH